MLVPGPLHPYGIQRLIKHWGKDQVVNVGQRANLYKTIKRLHEAGLIAVRQTERDQQYPERTVYELTEDGRGKRRVARRACWSPSATSSRSSRRRSRLRCCWRPASSRPGSSKGRAVLREDLARIERDLENLSASLPRVTLLDDEYRRAVTAAELAWIDGVLGDLRSGVLTWDREQLASVAMEDLGVLATDLPPEYTLDAEPAKQARPDTGSAR